MAGRLIRWLGAGLLLSAAPGAASAQPLVADLSSHLITITSSYSGTDLLLFGAVEENGDVVVVIRGPLEPVVVRRKERLAGVWVNRDSVVFEGVPGYYAVAATRPLEAFATPNLLARHEIGTDYLRFTPRGDLAANELATFRDAIVRNMQRVTLYPDAVGRVVSVGKRLFRTEVHFPANVPAGNYPAEVYLIRDNEVVTAQTTTLFIRKRGIERRIFDYAHRQPLWYGLTAVLLAMLAGWVAAEVFRRR